MDHICLKVNDILCYANELHEAELLKLCHKLSGLLASQSSLWFVCLSLRCQATCCMIHKSCCCHVVTTQLSACSHNIDHVHASITGSNVYTPRPVHIAAQSFLVQP